MNPLSYTWRCCPNVSKAVLLGDKRQHITVFGVKLRVRLTSLLLLALPTYVNYSEMVFCPFANITYQVWRIRRESNDTYIVITFTSKKRGWRHDSEKMNKSSFLFTSCRYVWLEVNLCHFPSENEPIWSSWEVWLVTGAVLRRRVVTSHM